MARYPISLFTPGSLMGAGAADPFLSLHREMNRLFDDVLRGGMASSGAPASAQRGALLAPHMDVTETDREVRIQAELPGVTEKDIEVSLNDDVLTIRAEKHQERKEERQGVHVSERAYGTFQRALRLPFPISQDQVQANFENGVLSITLPKAQPQERTRRIQVQGAQPPSAETQTGQSQTVQDQITGDGPTTPPQQGNGAQPASGQSSPQQS